MPKIRKMISKFAGNFFLKRFPQNVLLVMEKAVLTKPAANSPLKIGTSFIFPLKVLRKVFSKNGSLDTWNSVPRARTKNNATPNTIFSPMSKKNYRFLKDSKRLFQKKERSFDNPADIFPLEVRKLLTEIARTLRNS